MTSHVAGYPLERIGAAVNKLRISQGIRNKRLAQETQVDYGLFRQFEQGTRSLHEDKIIHICQRLGHASVKSLVSAAEKIPEITKASLASAVSRMARQQGLKIAELERKAGFRSGSLGQFVINRLHPFKSEVALEAVHSAAKELGFKSSGDLLKAAASLPPETEPQELREAVKLLQKAYGFTPRQMANALGIDQNYYQSMLRETHGRDFSVHVAAKLPARFGVKSLGELTEKAALAETTEPWTQRATRSRTPRER